MAQVESDSSTAYIDMVRNHRERAFDEGMKAMWNLAYKEGKTIQGFPENPYKIKQGEQRK